MILGKVCSDCREYKISFSQTLHGYNPEKKDEETVKLSVGNASQLNFPIYGKFDITRFSGSYPYIGIVRTQGTAVIVLKLKDPTVGLLLILKSIASVWSVITVVMLMAVVCGWLFWFAVSVLCVLLYMIRSLYVVKSCNIFKKLIICIS